MTPAEVESRIVPCFSDAQIEVEGADCSFTVRIISDDFKGVSPVKRQQQILALFSTELQSGALHALSVEARTLAEMSNQQQSASGLIQL